MSGSPDLAIATREAIQDMERRGVAGHVVHVSSMAGHRIPGPDSGMYAATEFAVRALTEALRQELRARKSPIRVTAVSPGHVRTEFADVFSGTSGAADALAARLKPLDAVDVARAILWVVTQPPHVEVHDVLVRPTAPRTRRRGRRAPRRPTRLGRPVSVARYPPTHWQPPPPGVHVKPSGHSPPQVSLREQARSIRAHVCGHWYSQVSPQAP